MTTLQTSLIDSLRDGQLHWFPECGLGWFPVVDQPYDTAYWDKYLRMDETAVGAALTLARCQWVAKHVKDGKYTVCDIGIGGGRFAKECDTLGFDINPNAVEWLKSSGRWHNPYEHPVDVATFWDSLEHIHRPESLLANVRNWVFVSIPIFQDAGHILRSKHYRKDEHVWYFTRQGFDLFMAKHGFERVAFSKMEQDCGREDIETFAYRRKQHG